jgi:hypothetical protein
MGAPAGAQAAYPQKLEVGAWIIRLDLGRSRHSRAIFQNCRLKSVALKEISQIDCGAQSQLYSK